MHPNVLTIINQLRSYQPERIILFGSYAYGQPQEDSDVDLLVIKKTTDHFHERQKKARLLLKSTIPVDIFVFTPEEFEEAKQSNPFIKEAVEMGKIVYG